MEVDGSIVVPSSPTRKLAAILHADVVGFSRLTAEDEDDTYRRLTETFRVMTDLISARRGRVVNYAGDAILAGFATATVALSCSVYLQQWLARRTSPPASRPWPSRAVSVSATPSGAPSANASRWTSREAGLSD